VLALLGMGLLVPAFTALFFGAGDVTLRVVAGAALDPATKANLYDAAVALGPASVAMLIFVAGHILGTVLIGAALWRARAIPAWAAVALIISQPMHLVFFLFVPIQAMDVASWGLTALGLGVAGLRVLGTPDDEWDLPPATA
jgi:hypothetical protein